MIAVQVAAALLLAALALWAVLGPLLGPAPVPAAADPLDDLADPLETPMGRALAALRELEFDRATGKLSDRDYAEMTARYSAEALRLQRQEDGVPPGTDVDPTCPTCGPRPEPGARFCSACGTPVAPGTACPHCGAALPAGARYCADCGAVAAPAA